jgi:hypothetical protein
MKQTLVVAFALLLSACSSADQTKTGAQTGAVRRPAHEVRSVLKALNKALVESEGERAPGFPDLKHVEVQLQARTEVDAGGQVKFVLVSGGVDTSLTLELEAPQATEAPQEDLSRRKAKSPIAQAILAAKKAYLGENLGAGPLASFQRGDITVEIGFEISDKANASIETGDLMPVGLSASAGVSAGKAHNIKLVYGNR